MGYNFALPGERATGERTVNHLTPPYGGNLVNLMVGNRRLMDLRENSRDWPSWDLDHEQVCDLELILSGGFSPLDGFMDRADVESVCRRMRRTDGTLWPVPVSLDISAELAEQLAVGDRLALRDPEGVMLAVLTVDEVWRPDRAIETEALFGTADPNAPGVADFLRRTRPYAVAGPVEGIQLPVHYDYRELRLTPAELRRNFNRLGWRRVLAFQTHQTMHRAHQALTERVTQELGANLLIHPVVGHGRPWNADHYTRVRCYQAMLPHYPKDMVRLSLVPLISRGFGPREALLQAIVHQNHGCSHFMVGNDMRGSILDTVDAPGFDPDEARQMLDEHRDQLAITMVPYQEMVYLERSRGFVLLDEVPEGISAATITGAEVKRRLAEGRPLPDWYTFPGVERELRRRHPPRAEQGFTIFLTGLSGAGKSTIANALRVKLLELGGRGVALLDGDLVRKHLSSELGFSKEHRDLNIRRIGFVAAEITRAGGVAICAPIAPYDSVRREVRQMIEPGGGFILIHVATPIEVCEERDRKGMYAKARAGIVKEFTGVSDPYEVPDNADVVVDTSAATPEEAVREVLLYLERQGYISAVGE
jgi:sulfate adenylyltransferase